MKRPALQNMRVGVLRMVFGTFEKRAPAGNLKKKSTSVRSFKTVWNTCPYHLGSIYGLYMSYIASNISLTNALLKQIHLFFIFISRHWANLLFVTDSRTWLGAQRWASLLPKNLSIMGVLLQKADSCFSLFSLTSSSSRAFVSSISTPFYCSAIGVLFLILSITFLTNSSSPSGFTVSWQWNFLSKRLLSSLLIKIGHLLLNKRI